MSTTIFAQLTTLLLLVLSTSCDPGQELNFINESGEDVVITIVEKNYSNYSIKNNMDRATDSDTTVLTLGTSEADNRHSIFYGIGHWKVLNCIDSLIYNTESITIQKANQGTKSYTRPAEIDALYRSGLTGSSDQIINVVVK